MSVGIYLALRLNKSMVDKDMRHFSHHYLIFGRTVVHALYIFIFIRSFASLFKWSVKSCMNKLSWYFSCQMLSYIVKCDCCELWYSEDNSCCWLRIPCWSCTVRTWILHWWQVSLSLLLTNVHLLFLQHMALMTKSRCENGNVYRKTRLMSHFFVFVRCILVCFKSSCLIFGNAILFWISHADLANIVVSYE